MKSPYLSVVLTSRNDGYAGGMLPRLQMCIDSLLEQAERHQLELELILVDWNPPDGKPFLKDALVWSRNKNYSTVRVIEVPHEIHNKLPFALYLPFLAHIARNVGVRRAKGAYVLVTATDILFSESLIAYLATKPLRIDRNYRVSRHDVPDDVLKIGSLQDRLNFSDENILHVYQQPPGPIMPGMPLLHINMAGDFVLLSREKFHELHGIPEERELHSTTFDCVFCFMMYASGIQEEILSDPHRIYHINHDSLWQSNDTWLQRFQKRPWMQRIQQTMLIPESIRLGLSRLSWKFTQSPSRLDQLGIPHLNTRRRAHRLIFEEICRNAVDTNTPIPFNDESWGLGQYNLNEYTILQASWDT